MNDALGSWWKPAGSGVTDISAIYNALQSDSFRCKAVDKVNEPLELLFYGVVGDPVDSLDARGVAELLTANRGRPVNVRINSPGGLAFDGLTIFNALVAHDAAVTTTVEGLAASAAAIIAMAGKPVRMLDNGTLYVHRAMGLAMGNASILLDVATVLEQVDQSITATIAGRRGLKPANVAAMLAGKVDGTTYSADAAKAAGLVDEILKVPSAVKNALAGTDAFLQSRAFDDAAVKARDLWLADARRKLELAALAAM